MFQYAAGKALAERHGVRLKLDLNGFRKYSQRPFSLDRLSVPEAYGEPISEKSTSYFVRGLWIQRINRVLDSVRLPKLSIVLGQYFEPHFQFDPEFELLDSNMSLFGYFQSERYFSSIADDLRGWFAPAEPLGAAAAAALQRIEASRLPVSMHIRRGDYLKPVTAEVHGILDGSYYRRAANRIESALGGEVDYFVFSDDAAAAEQMLDFLPNARLNHIRGDPDRPWEDMALMARCRHHVIANSSFSWWGAWLNQSRDKIVIAPRAWFVSTELSKKDTNDLYPAGWVLI